jgi:DNA-binding transcriptional MerR regulator
MKMQKRTFRIGELAKHLAIERFVIRFWEKEFALKTNRSHGGQRFYTHDDLQTFSLIKDLLYNRGFTIGGAKKQIQQARPKIEPAKAQAATAHPEKLPKSQPAIAEIELLKKEKDILEEKVLLLQQQLVKLRELL